MSSAGLAATTGAAGDVVVHSCATIGAVGVRANRLSPNLAAPIATTTATSGRSSLRGTACALALGVGASGRAATLLGFRSEESRTGAGINLIRDVAHEL